MKRCAPLLLGLLTFTSVTAQEEAIQLKGIIAFGGKKFALVQLNQPRKTEAILQVGERLGSLEVVQINEARSEVVIRSGKEDPRTIMLPLATPALEKRTVHLQGASVEPTIEIFQTIVQRTVIRPPKLPAGELNVRSGADLNRQQAADLLREHLEKAGLSLSFHGEKFVLITTEDTKRFADAIQPVPSGAPQPKEDVFPPGLIKFRHADLFQVLDVYGELAATTMLLSGQLPPAKATLKTAARHTRQEAIWALQATFALGGVNLIPYGKFTVAVPHGFKVDLPDYQPELRKADLAQAATPKKYNITDAKTLLENYAQLVGREPGPLDQTVSRFRTELRTGKELAPEDALLGLEALARLFGATFKFPAPGKVELVSIR